MVPREKEKNALQMMRERERERVLSICSYVLNLGAVNKTHDVFMAIKKRREKEEIKREGNRTEICEADNGMKEQ